MISVRGTYEDGTIKLLDPVDIKGDANVVVTFLDDSFPFSDEPADTVGGSSAPPRVAVKKENKPEEYYERLRKHKRFKARGHITIVHGEEESVFPLNDYSAGGLSFFCDRVFDIGKPITAALKYSATDDVLVMNFEIAVRGIFEEDGRYKIGCQFIDDVDEELWHTIMA